MATSVKSAVKMERVREILKTLTATELEDAIEQASAYLGLRFYRFLDLPAELRNSIYRLAIQAEDVEQHITSGIAPPLLKVNRQITTEFQGLYYSHEYMGVESYDEESKSWVEEKDARLFQLMLSRRVACRVQQLSAPRKIVMSRQTIDQAMRTQNMLIDPNYCMGVFKWKGSSKPFEAFCLYNDIAVELDIETQKREEEARKKVEKARKRVENARQQVEMA